MYIDDINLCDKNEKELESLRETVRINNQNVEIEFGIVKCTMLVMKKRQTTHDGSS